ncbi:hypothetical protein VNO77_18955 [Canavalia gladiata]|uniref:Uncharacterized protein n=1 Tax=Canavalia gladiata TaxID=3824 RepID=A0AAN9LRP1_CANGL
MGIACMIFPRRNAKDRTYAEGVAVILDAKSSSIPCLTNPEIRVRIRATPDLIPMLLTMRPHVIAQTEYARGGFCRPRFIWIIRRGQPSYSKSMLPRVPMLALEWTNHATNFILAANPIMSRYNSSQSRVLIALMISSPDPHITAWLAFAHARIVRKTMCMVSFSRRRGLELAWLPSLPEPKS